MFLRIRLFRCSEAKKARRKMWKHILNRWIRFDFNHSPNEGYTMDIKNHMKGDIVEVFCNCDKQFWIRSDWEDAVMEAKKK